MRAMRATAGMVAMMVAFGTTEAAAAPPDEPEREVLEFLDISRLVAVHDAGPRGSEPQPGDVYVFDNVLRHPDRSDAVTRQPLGRFPSTCTVVQGTQAECEGTLELRDGTVTVTGTPDLTATPIDMVVTGGTGRYATATGTARLTATDHPGTHRLTVLLERPAS
jgi:Dirigent-like protein